MADGHGDAASAPRVAILGGGPAGVGAAFKLHESARGRATVVEQNDRFGGNAGSFDWEGQRLDFGSHRLHPACDARILDDLRRLLGDDLLDRPRHGRIVLAGRFIHFPLKPLDLLLRLPPGFGLGMARDALRSRFRRRRAAGQESFASVLREGLGPTMCERFYFPYAQKIWGLAPEEIAGAQARRRVAASTPWRIVRKVLNAVPGFKPPGAGRFFYPRRGYGQISEALARAAQAAGASLLTNHRVKLLRVPRAAEPWFLIAESGGREFFVEAEHLWSTLPITLLPTLVEPAAPAEVVAAAARITFRAMLLIYLRLPVERFTRYDAHYLPQAEVAITRVSEPKNYSDVAEPAGATTLCVELPCDAGDRFWKMSDAVLGALAQDELARCGLPLPARASAVRVVRLAHAYPIYRNGYEEALSVVDRWAASLPRFVTYGRQGLFAHDNTHHALAMAYAALDCLGERGFDRVRWQGWRRVFSTHVVED